MQDEQKPKILAGLLRLLRPIVRILLKSGIGYREFSEIAKSAFVDVATLDYGLRGRPTNISRVAVMTGMTRKEVKRIRSKIDQGLPADIIRDAPPAEIIGFWHADPDFLDSDGSPLKLPFEGSEISFSELVRRYGGDIPPGAMRTELKRVGVISVDSSGDISVLQKHYIAADDTEKLIRSLNTPLYGLALSIGHNLNAEKDSDHWVERQAFTKHIRSTDLKRIRRITKDRSEEFVESINDLFSAYETFYGEESESESDSKTVGVGVYYYEDEPTKNG